MYTHTINTHKHVLPFNLFQFNSICFCYCDIRSYNKCQICVCNLVYYVFDVFHGVCFSVEKRDSSKMLNSSRFLHGTLWFGGKSQKNLCFVLKINKNWNCVSYSWYLAVDFVRKTDSSDDSTFQMSWVYEHWCFLFLA